MLYVVAKLIRGSLPWDQYAKKKTLDKERLREIKT
jgi:hypothetical protein